MATPTEFCQGREPEGITLTGYGFATNLDQERSMCRYETEGGLYFCKLGVKLLVMGSNCVCGLGEGVKV